MACPSAVIIGLFPQRAIAGSYGETDTEDTPTPPECPRGDSTPGQAAPGSGAPHVTRDPIHALRGSIVESAVDLSLPGPVFDWSHTRRYDSRLSYSTAPGAPPAMGNKWLANSQTPFLVAVTGAVEVQMTASSKRVFTESGGNYTAPTDYRATLEIDSGSGTADEIYKLTELDTDRVYYFHGLDSSVAAETRGKIREITNEHYVAQPSDLGYGIRYSYDSSGRTYELTTADPQASYIYYHYQTTGDEAGRLMGVYVWNATHIIAKAEYSYPGFSSLSNVSTDIGGIGSLVQVRVGHRTSDSANNYIYRYTQYRYDSNGVMTGVLESADIERVLADDANLTDPADILEKDDDYLVGGGSALTEYMSRRFVPYSSNEKTDGTGGPPDIEGKYTDENADVSGVNEIADSANPLIKEEIVGLGCTSCGGSGGGTTYKYYYVDINDGPTSSTDADEVCRIVAQDVYDSDNTLQYRRLIGVNYKGVALRDAIVEDPTGTSGLNVWCKSKLLDSDLRVTEDRMPSAHLTVNSDTDIKKFLDPTDGTNDSDTVSSSQGVVYKHGYDATTKNREWTKLRCPTGASSSTDYYIQATDWGNGTTAPTDYPIKIYRYPGQETTDTDGDHVDIAYTFWDNDLTLPKKVTVTIPNLGTDQNSSTSDTVIERYFDRFGRLRWAKDGEGYINYYSYHPVFGHLSYVAIDVDPTSAPSGADDSYAGWVQWSDDGSGGMSYDPSGVPTRSATTTALELVTKLEFDDLGRRVRSTEPDGSNHYVAYNSSTVDRICRTIVFPYWNGSGCDEPIQVTETNLYDDVVQRTYTLETTFSSTSNTKLSTEPTSSDYTSLTEYEYDDVTGQLEYFDRYHDADGTTRHDDFHRTSFLYDARGRHGATIQDVATGKFQVVARLYDFLGRVIETRRGVATTAPTNYADLDNSSPGSPANFAGYATSSEIYYDGADDTNRTAVGDGHVTQTKRAHTAEADGDPDEYSLTVLHRTYRGHLRGLERRYHDGTTTDVTPYQVIDVDWMGRATAAAVYTTEPSTWPNDASDQYAAYVSTTSSGGRFAMTKTKYDDLGRVYQTLRYPGTQDTKHFEINNYYDRRGKLVATGDVFGAHREIAYDGAGRPYQSRVVKDISNANPYTSGAFDYNLPHPKPDLTAMTSGDEGVIEISHSEFDAAGNVTAQHTVELDHGDSDGLSFSSGEPSDGIRTTTLLEYDGANRLEKAGYYGAGNQSAAGGAWTATSYSFSSSLPSESDSKVLVTAYTYDVAGRQELVKDPMHNSTTSSQMKTFYDDLGRPTFVVENWKSGYDPNSSIGNTAGENRTAQFEYDGLGDVTKITVYNNGTQTAEAQVTDYFYLDDYDASRGTHAIYPDASNRSAETTWSTAADQVRLEYNLDGTVKRTKDQRGVEITYTYDSAQRLSKEEATAIPAGVDDTVEAIGRTYDLYGRVDEITSYGASSSILNQIDVDYDDSGQVEDSWQEHDGAVGGSTPKVKYDYATTADASNRYTNGLRLATMRHPLVSNAKVAYYYGSGGSINDRLSRVQWVKLWGGSFFSGQTQTSAYEYTGTGRLVRINAYVASGGSTNNISRLEHFTSSGNYTSFDRFGRTTTQVWKLGSTTHCDIDYEFDYNGNRTDRDVVGTGTDGLDQQYKYDEMDRLTEMDQGTFTSGSITNKNFEQDFTLDQLSNWSNFTEKNGKATTLDQDREHNDVNEIDTDETHGDVDNPITTTTGTDWADPIYDAVGNMTTIPKPKDLANGYTAKYDAWSRLVLLSDGSNDVQMNRYDGLHRRVFRHDDTNDDGNLNTNDDIRHFYWSTNWQCVAEGVDSGSGVTSDAIYSHHAHYIDAVAARMRSGDGHFYLQDANFNVVALMDLKSGIKTVVERYNYSPHGATTVLDADYSQEGEVGDSNPDHDFLSDVENELLYSGRRLDPESSLYQVRNRYYHTDLGRFVRRDPINYCGGLNLYAYVDGRPTKFIDPAGLQCQDVDWFPIPNDISARWRTFEHPKFGLVQQQDFDGEWDVNTPSWSSVGWQEVTGKRVKRVEWSSQSTTWEIRNLRTFERDGKCFASFEGYPSFVKRQIFRYYVQEVWTIAAARRGP